MIEEIDLRYPIGRVEKKPLKTEGLLNTKAKEQLITDIRMCAGLIENAVLNLDEHQLETPYRPGGWTVKQVVHHVADSHMNAFIRFKLALTEDNPTIKPYDEAAWATLPDNNLPINISITLIHALHARWYELLININDSEWEKTVFHPEQKRTMTVWDLLETYAWHGKHHAAHITALRDRNGWN